MNAVQTPRVILKPKRERSILRRHPWVFSGAIAHVDGQPDDGDIVEVQDNQGDWLARGYINRQSQITVRILTWDPKEAVDRSFWQRRVDQAILGREALDHDPSTTAYRLIHAESDDLPGLVVDRYGDHLVIQCLTLGIERYREDIVALLVDRLASTSVFERSDVEVRKKEGLSPKTGLLWGQEPPQQIEILENGHRFWVDVRTGQKTGFYLDQRENRARLPEFSQGMEMLDAFSYSGSCGLYALAGGASQVTFVESSGPALEMTRQNLMLNGYDATAQAFVEGNVFQVLRDFRSQGRTFDGIVLDPPKLAPTGRNVQRATRAYKDINLLAFQLLRAGGVLFSSSCSGTVSADLFQKVLFGAALDAGRTVQIVGHLHQGSDHPVALTFPQGTYLKGLICRVW